ncbi:MAG: HAMP domain-containing sensor histidine kinase [Lachnospiraceae bacterium]|nr:HAMP domain-containing sensor histidine kinase [Lachnospiraceae bacterium]
MGKISFICFILGILFLTASVLLTVIVMIYHRKYMKRLELILDGLEQGSFQESSWDESRLSRLELRMASFLSRSRLSQKTLRKEEERMRRLISDISHQTKTPIANILLYSEMLSEQPLSKEQSQMAEEIQFQGKKLQWLVEALLKLSRLENDFIQIKASRQPLYPLLQKEVRAYSHAAKEKGVSLSVSCDETKEAVFDARWTEEVIGNLLDNAIKYTPSGGNIRLDVLSYSLFLRIDVKDTGIGISEEEQTKVFGRFYRSETVGSQPGVGIGLYLAREIVGKEGGYMRLSSVPGEGSCFSVFLPKEETNRPKEDSFRVDS